MEEVKSAKRVRTDCKRWSKEEKMYLLQIIIDDPSRFEKPTAQIYYRKMIEKYPVFKEFGWKSIRDKMRNLKMNFTKAVDWRNTTASSIDGDDAEKTIREYILKVCEDFDALELIFGGKKNIIPLHLFKRETKETSEQVETSDDFPDSGRSTPTTKRKYSNSGINCLPEEQKEYLKEKLPPVSHAERTLKIEEGKLKIEEKRIALEEKKIAEESRLKQMEIEGNLALNKMRLEKEMELKELELRYKYNKE